jgi:hypothetical protein
VDQELNLDEEFVTELNHMEVILEGTRRVDEWEILKKNIPHPQVVFKINKSVEKQRDSVNLTANEWRIISLVDGVRPVQQVVEDSGQDEFVVYRMINSLISSGLIEPSGGSAALPAGDKSEVPAIVQIYHSILQSVLKLTEKAVGTRAHNLFEEAKAQMPAEYSGLLRSFDCRKDAKTNLKAVIGGAAAGSPPSNETLVSGFNSWILAILQKQKEILSDEAMAANLKELTRPDAAWQKFPGKSNIKGAIFSSIVQTAEQFQKGLSGAGKGKGSGILSFLKRK